MHYFFQPEHAYLLNNLVEKPESLVALFGIIGTIIGVLIGFFLTTWKEIRENKNLKKALILELEGNLRALDQKKDTIQKVINSLIEERMLPALGVPLPTLIFDKHLASIIKLFNPIERDLIQNIYGRLHLIDNFLNNFENKLLAYLNNKFIKDPYTALITMLRDLLIQCSNTQELIKSILEGNPVDIYNRKQRNIGFEGAMKDPTPEDIKEERKI